MLFAVVFAGYTVGSQIGFSWFRTDAGPTFFPPAGLTLAALVLTPRRRWPAVLLAAFAAELSSDLANDLDPVASVGYAIANSAEPLVGALTIGRLGGFAFTRQGLTAFLTGGVLLGPAVGAAIGATASLLAADDLSWRAIAGRWWLGDALGVLVVGASLLSLGTPPPPRWPGWRRALEALVLCGGSIGGVVLVFETQQWDLAYVPILLLVAVAFRLGVRHVALTGSAMAFVIAAQATLASHAVWDELSVERTLGLVHLQLLIGIVMITALALAVEVEARDEASRDRATAESEALREQAARRRTERLARLATALTAATQLSEVAVVIGAEAATAVGPEMASLVLIGDREAAVVAPDPVDAAGAAIVAARDDRVVYVDGTAGTAETPVVHAALPVSMPRGEGLAALVFSWPDGSVLGVAERRDLEIVRELIGQAVERARLVALERSRSRRREALQVLST